MQSGAKSEDLHLERPRSPEDGPSLQLPLAQRQTEECIATLKKDPRSSIQLARSNSSSGLVKIPKGIIPLKEFIMSQPNVDWNLVRVTETRFVRVQDALATTRLATYVDTVEQHQSCFNAWKRLSEHRSVHEVVFCAAVFRAFDMAKSRTNDAIQSMQKGQLVLLGKNDTHALTSFHLDITYDDRKFSLQVTRKRSDIYCFTINGGTITAKVREQPDGSLYVTVGHLSRRIKGQEEALGLRLTIGSQTIMVPNVYDPSELRVDENGPVVCSLHEESTENATGNTIVELEDMKSITTSLKSPEDCPRTPRIFRAAREQLAKLELKDPSEVKKISPFEGVFSLGEDLEAVAAEPLQEVQSLLDGFCIEANGPELVKKMFQGFRNYQAAVETIRGLLEKYLSNERPFFQTKQTYDQLLLEIIDQGKDDLEKVLFMIAAHNNMASRYETVMAILSEMVAAEKRGISYMCGPDMHEEMGVHQKVVEISQQTAKEYGDMPHLAQQLLGVLPQDSGWSDWLCCGSRPSKVRRIPSNTANTAPALESLEEVQWPWFEWLQVPALSWIF